MFAPSLEPVEFFRLSSTGGLAPSYVETHCLRVETPKPCALFGRKGTPLELVWVSDLSADRVYIYIIPPLLISDQFLQKYFRCKINILEYCFLSHGDILTTPSAKNKEHTVIIIMNSGFSFICSRVIYPGVVKVIYLGWGLSWILPGRLPGFFSLLLPFQFWCCLVQGSDIVQRPCTEVCLLYTYLIGVYSSRFSL